VPTGGSRIFSWLATLLARSCCTSTRRCCFALGFLTTFTLGGISGQWMLAMIPFDIHVSATYFIVAHTPLRCCSSAP